MSRLRRIVQNPTSWNISEAVRNLIPYPIRRYASSIPYPLGRDASSLPKLYPDVNSRYIDRRRPICLRDRVTTMIQMPDLDAASELSRLAVLDEFRDDRDTVFICNSVIGAMCEAKRYDEATSLFNYFFNEFQALPNMLSCNLIIKAFCDRDRIDEALELYDHIVLLDGPFSPGVETYRILTKALVDAKRLIEALDLVLDRTMTMTMTSFDLVVVDILIRGYLEADDFSRARNVVMDFGRDGHDAHAIYVLCIMEASLKQGIGQAAAMKDFARLDKFELVEQPFLRNKALRVLMEHGKKTEAWDLFKNMIEICDAEAVDIMWKLCSENNVPFHRFRKTCYTTILVRLCQQGNMSEAEKIFAEIEQEDVTTFRAMINGYVDVGRIDDAIKMLNKVKIFNLRKHRAA